MTPEFLMICNEQEKRRIIVPNILHINTDDYLSTFHLTNNQKFTCSKSLSEISAMLPDYFIQISRSCVVNMNEILSIKRGSRVIVLSNYSELVVSTRRMKGFNEALANQNVALAR